MRADSRIAALDVLRGVAILGTFASNAWLFAHPGGPAARLAGGTAADLAETALLTLSNGKFLALLTLLFGVGIELQYRSAARRGRPWPGRYPLRAVVLLAEGTLHYVLVFEFDVLMGYAVASLLVAHLIGRSDRAQRAWIAGLGGVYAAALLGLTALVMASRAGSTPPGVSGTTANWTAQVRERLDGFLLYRAELVLVVPSAVVFFLVGARLVRAGAFADTVDGARLRRRLAAVGLGAGVPLNVLTAAAGPEWFLVDCYLVPLLIALGLLAMVTGLVLRTSGGRPRRGVAAVGRTALSCYVLQNVLASVLCYDWGLGLAARFGDARPWWVVGLWAGVSAATVAFAVLWLRRFDRGPLELLAHRLVSGARSNASAR